MFEWKITLGESIGIAVTVLAIAISVALTVWRLWSARHPFTLRFSDQPLDLPPEQRLRRTFRRVRYVTLGKTELTIALKTRHQTVGNPFNVHLVRRDWSKWGRWIYIPREEAEIINIEVPHWEREAGWERDFIGPNEIKKTRTDTGGFEVDARKPKTWLVGQHLWIELTVTVERPACVWLSFEGATDRRAFARGLVRAARLPTSGTASPPP